jgi:hypothetical protein
MKGGKNDGGGGDGIHIPTYVLNCRDFCVIEFLEKGLMHIGDFNPFGDKQF